MKLALRIGAGVLLVVLVVLAGVFVIVRLAVNDGAVPVIRSTAELFAPGAPHAVLAVWAHPDDEIIAAGTLARLAHDGADVTLVYFTHGEGAHDTGFTSDQLHALRPEEARAAGKALGARDVVVLDYGDSRLTRADPVAAKTALEALILAHRPSTVISFDERVGYYGHPDHAQAGRWTAEVVRAGMGEPGFPVKRLYQATLPEPAIALARRYISAFRTHYPADPAEGLPAPSLAVPIASQAFAKRAVLGAHRTQVKVIDDVQPGGRRLPAWLYYRIFDREYFTLAAGG
jgi:LmbE family N-acetylglucosaminyl deacetylase